MTWARFDDRYHDNRKVKLAWRAHPRAVGLHAMAVTYCAMHELDGLVDPMWIEERLPNKAERAKVLGALLGAGLFDPAPNDHYLVHDYLDYNPSREQAEAKRIDRSEAGKKGADVRWGHAEPNGNSHSSSHGNSHGKPDAVAMADPNSPGPARPEGQT